MTPSYSTDLVPCLAHLCINTYGEGRWVCNNPFAPDSTICQGRKSEQAGLYLCSHLTSTLFPAVQFLDEC